MLAGSVIVGLALANGYKKNLSFILDLSQFMEKLESNFTFQRDTLTTILKNNKSNFGPEFNSFLNEYESNLNNPDFLSTWSKNEKSIPKEIKSFVVDLFSSLGKSDCQTQVSLISTSRKELDLLLEKSRKKVNGEANLSQKLGVVLGLALFILVL